MDQAATLRTVAATAISFFAVRLSSVVEPFLTTDVSVGIASSVIHVKLVRQRNNQVRVGWLACLVAVPAVVAVCPVLTIGDWLLSSRLARGEEGP